MSLGFKVACPKTYACLTVQKVNNGFLVTPGGDPGASLLAELVVHETWDMSGLADKLAELFGVEHTP